MEELSNCCGASRWSETDVCSDCKEHAEFNEENEEKVYIDFLNKKKGFKQDRIKFNSYEAAVKWAKKNLEKYDEDMIHYKYCYITNQWNLLLTRYSINEQNEE